LQGEKEDKEEGDGEEGEGDGEEEEEIVENPVTEEQLKTLSDEQRAAFHQGAHSSRNMFLTGEAGTGKTYVLKLIVQQLRSQNHHLSVAVVAPTGIWFFENRVPVSRRRIREGPWAAMGTNLDTCGIS